MICADLSAIIGIACWPVTEDGAIARIDVPFKFDDGDSLPVYVETIGGQLRFFDDGGVLLHFAGRGMDFGDGRRTRFIKTAAAVNSAALSESGELEAWAKISEAPQAFAKYLGAILQIAAWERDQRGVSTDTTLLIDEVALNLRAWKPSFELSYEPEFDGISGQRHKLDLLFGGKGVVATTPHHSATAATIRRLLDIRGASSEPNFLVIIDDRAEPDDAEREGLVMQALAEVISFTRLEKNARIAGGSRSQN